MNVELLSGIEIINPVEIDHVLSTLYDLGSICLFEGLFVPVHVLILPLSSPKKKNDLSSAIVFVFPLCVEKMLPIAIVTVPLLLVDLACFWFNAEASSRARVVIL